jgi:hypothetical protein
LGPRERQRDVRECVYRRDELYEQVWTEPVRTVAKRYGVSDVALAKTCKRLGVPLPGRGFWARRNAGQDVGRAPLAPLAAGAVTELKRAWAPTPLSRKVPANQERHIAEETEPSAAIVVAATLDKPHSLVSHSRRLLAAKQPYNGMVMHHGDSCLDLCVSKQSLDRALRIMDALIRAFASCGFAFEVTDSGNQRGRDDSASNATRVQVDGEWLEFGIKERWNLLKPPPPPKHASRKDEVLWRLENRTRRVPNGRLLLRITTRVWPSPKRDWEDKEKRKLEEMLDDFVAGLRGVAEAMKAERARDERERKERAAQEEREWARQ